MCSNIELFDEYTAKVFSHLYQRFPVKEDFNLHSFFDLGEADPYYPGQLVDASGQRDEVAERKAEVAWHTLIWLKESGFIMIEREQPYLTVSGVTLTIKGLEVLKSEPSSLTPKKRIGNELIAALKAGNLLAAKELVRQAVRISFIA